MIVKERGIVVTPKDGEFYINRLTKLCELRQEIDAGNAGWNGWWATTDAEDPEVVKDKQGNTKLIQKITSLPLYEHKRQKGLRYGILFSIMGVRNIMHDMGMGDIAEDILLFDSTMPGGKKHERK